MADQPQDPLPNSSPSPQPPPEIPDGSIHLKIRVPHGNLPASISATTFSLGVVPITSRIGDVRRMIQQTVPSNPATSRQRLLYGGRSLYDDAESIQDALNTRRSPEQREYVIHLIVRAEAGSDARTESPGRVRTQTPASAQQIHQNALQQHHQLHQRMHQQNLAHGQQPPFPPFMLPGMPGPQGVPTQGQMGMPQQLQQHILDPATFQRLQMQQAHMTQGQQAAAQTQPNGTTEGASARTTSASVPPPSSETQTQNNADQAQQGQAQARPQTQAPEQGAQTQQQQHAHQHHHMNGNFRAEVRGPNGERWEYHQHTFNLPHGHHMGRGSAYVMANNAPPQQGHPGMQAHPQPPFARHPQFGQPGWVPGMPAIPGIPQINIPHIQMPQMGMPVQQGQWPPQQAAHAQGLSANVNTASAPAPTGTNALDRARNDLAEIRRMLDELRDHTNHLDPNAQVERQTVDWVGQVEQRVRDVEGYIDPFGLGTGGNTQNASNANATTTSSRDANAAGTDAQRVIGRTRIPSMRQRLGLRPTFSSLNEPEQPTNSQDVTAYLLSSPEGPQAIVYSPQHGAYTSVPQPTPTRTQQSQHQQPGEMQRDPEAQAAAHRFIQDVAAQRLAGAQAMAAGRDPAMQDPLGPLQPVLGHFWLLLRILIFAYFLLGSNMGYTKMLMLAGIGLAFWAFRLGVLGNPEVRNRARAWWEGVVGLPPRPAVQNGQQQQAQGAAQPQVEQNQGQRAQAGAEPPAAQQLPPAPAQQQQQRPQNRMPTPEQVAQRLLNENADQNRGWLREQIRPVERAVALFVASLWPGIGEAHVRAQRELREQDERRAAEAEVEARRRAEEESAAQEKKEGEGGGGVAQVGTDGQAGRADGSAEAVATE